MLSPSSRLAGEGERVVKISVRVRSPFFMRPKICTNVHLRQALREILFLVYIINTLLILLK